mmetsp:Transcript_77596/g.142010  ORF Transcript_77596/g.142010 Transcript_77596/m.142010 type:complete len:212 (+) Transcript_77596:58-693(+)
MRATILGLLYLACAANGRRVQASKEPTAEGSAKALAAFLLASKEPTAGYQAGLSGLSSVLAGRSRSPVMQSIEDPEYLKQDFMKPPQKGKPTPKGGFYPKGPFGDYGIIGEEPPEGWLGDNCKSAQTIKFQEGTEFLLFQMPTPNSAIQPDLHPFFSLQTVKNFGRGIFTPIGIAVNVVWVAAFAFLCYLYLTPNELMGWTEEDLEGWWQD